VINWVGGDMTFRNPVSFENYGTFNIQCDRDYTSGGAALASTFNNYGTVTKSVGAAGAQTEFQVTFNDLADPNTGAPAKVNVNAGTLLINLGTGEDHTATYSIQPGAVLTFGAPFGGLQTFHNGTTFNGGGTVQFAGTFVNIPAFDTVESQSCAVVISAGLWDGNGAGTFNSRGSLKWSGGTLRNLSLNAYGPVQITGDQDKTLIGTVLTLRGGTTWSGTGDILVNGASIINYGQFDVQNDQKITNLMGVPPSLSIFRNDDDGAGNKGTFTKTDGVGETEIDITFINKGDLLLNGSTLTFEGKLEQDAGTTQLQGGTLNVNDTFLLYGGTLLGSGTLNGNLDNSGGVLDAGSAPGTLTITGSYEQDATSTLRVSYDTETDRWSDIVIQGSTTLGGTLALALPNGAPAAPFGFLFLTADGGLMGAFATTPVGWTVGYTGDAVTLDKN
jgi:hypothetical protein